MSKKDYESFLFKIDQLNQLVELLNNSPEKYKLFIRCKTHDDVVKLANFIESKNNFNKILTYYI